MPIGIRTWKEGTGELLYDSTAEHTLFNVDEQVITGNSVNLTTGLILEYPAYTGKRLSVTFVSPYQNGSIDGYGILACRLTYPNNIPTITISFDNTTATIPKADGYLIVFDTGASL